MSIEQIPRDIFFHIVGKGIEIDGKENIPSKGPAVIVFNHMGLVEGFVPLWYLPFLPVVFTKVENFQNPFLLPLLRGTASIPVKRGEVDREALKAGIAALTQGKFLVTAPEGTRGRTRDGDRLHLKMGKDGIVYMAVKAAAALDHPIPIVPMAIWGTEGVLPEVDDKEIPWRDRLQYRRAKIHVRVAPAFLMQPPQKNARFHSRDLAPLTEALMCSFRDMLPDSYSGVYEGVESPFKPGDDLFITV